jgi:Do/DeqQ family serine protease
MVPTLRFALLVLTLGSALAAGFVPAPAGAQERRVPTQGDLRLSYAPLVKQVAPAVVNVYAAKVVQNRNPLFDDPIFRRFFGVPGNQNQVQRSLGSGVIVDPSGLVVTNVHVIEGADDIKVALADKREFEAEIVLKDKRTDLAVLRLKNAKEQFPALEFSNSDALQVGDMVLAIGNPFGVGQTVTHGIVSALARTQIGITDYQFFIQTDAPINPGNSGGALIDLAGKLVGINTAIFSRSGGNLGIGFAIPASTAREVMAGLVKDGQITRGWIGVEPQDLTPEIAASLNLPVRKGVLITGELQNVPAFEGGVRPGDVVVKVAEAPIANQAQLLSAVAALKPQSHATISVLRGERPLDIQVTVVQRPRQPVRVRE